jgi:hypothetical protein
MYMLTHSIACIEADGKRETAIDERQTANVKRETENQLAIGNGQSGKRET